MLKVFVGKSISLLSLLESALIEKSIFALNDLALCTGSGLLDKPDHILYIIS